MTNHSSEAEQQLLIRGIPSYFGALRAMQEFRTAIPKLSESVLSGKLEKVCKALGVDRIEPKKIKHHLVPSRLRGTWDEEWADLMAEMWFGDYFGLFVGLWWERLPESDAVKVWATADLWVKKEKYSRYWEKVHTLAPDLETDGREIFLRKSCSPGDDAKTLFAKLDRMLDRWCVVWKKTGGLASIKGKN